MPRAITTSFDLAVPLDLVLLTKPGPFLTMPEPVYAKGMGALVVMGFHVQHHYPSRRGILHGDMVTPLADMALGYYLTEPGEGTGGVLAISTVDLTMGFVASAGEGDWIEITPEGLYAGSKLAFAQALSHRGDRLIVRVSIVFAMLGGRV